MNRPPLGPISTTLRCARLVPDGECGAPAVWHLSWFDPTASPFDWESSLACQEHRDEAQRSNWQIGWRHRVLPACAMPGSLLQIAESDEDEDGLPLTFCFHPWDFERATNEAAEPIGASR